MANEGGMTTPAGKVREGLLEPGRTTQSETNRAMEREEHFRAWQQSPRAMQGETAYGQQHASRLHSEAIHDDMRTYNDHAAFQALAMLLGRANQR
jgi:hypothetical protein